VIYSNNVGRYGVSLGRIRKTWSEADAQIASSRPYLVSGAGLLYAHYRRANHAAFSSSR
jgi:hypothetical protein